MYFIPSNMLMLSMLLISTLMVISSSNWIMVWAALELNLLSFIPMMMYTKSNQEIEAATKYFLSQALGSAIMISFSLMLWSNLTNSTIISILMLSLMIKLGAAPCHFWFPSVMSSISWNNCLLLVTWQKIAPLMTIIFPVLSISISKLMLILAPMNAIIGGLLGLNQTRIKTIIAYSSITHTGWILAPLIPFMPSASIMYFTMYVFIVSPLIILFINIESKLSTQLNKLMSSSAITVLLLTTMFMSLGGLPPLTGFMPKLMLIDLLTQFSSITIIMLIAGSLMNLFFYLNVTFNMIMSLQAHTKLMMLPLKYKPVSLLLSSSFLGILMLT